jgi:hypothetical protein
MDFTTEQLQTGLGASLTATVVIIGIALVLAHQHRAKAHIAFIGLFLLAFLVTLYFAETLGRRYTFDHISYPIHMSIAIFTAGFTLAPLITGTLHYKGKAERKTHMWVSRAWGVCLVLALVTGGWMISNGTLKAATPSGADVAPVGSKS